MIRLSREPRYLAGVMGMVLVAALYLGHALLAQAGRGGLGMVWLAALALPGVLAAHLSWGRGMAHAAVPEGARAGIVTAHFAAVLQVAVLVVTVLTLDWQRYEAQVGGQIAQAVREAALPAAAVVGAILVVLTYAGCAVLGGIGAVAYSAVRGRWSAGAKGG